MKLLGAFDEKPYGFNQVKIDISTLNNGINSYGDFFIKKDKEKILYVIDKKCDHAGGRLIKKKNKAICFLHGWELNLDNLKYNNSHIEKSGIPFDIQDNTLKFYAHEGFDLVNPFFKDIHQDNIEIGWINHATIIIKSGDFSIVTDPWLFGPAFITGWWLEGPTNLASIEDVKNASCIFISHNHPDHLHPESLSIIDKDKLIITPNFNSKSTEKYLNKLGFINVKTVDFSNIYSLSDSVQISPLKSGDFREDSGLYINAGGKELLFTVDSNFLNSHKLPKNITLLATSFTSGASGYPLIYENLTEEEKNKIIRRNKNSTKSEVMNYLKLIKPAYYLPYAGMFMEKAKRDHYILKTNKKVLIDEYSDICEHLNIKLIRPDKNVSFFFNNNDDIKIKNTHQNIKFVENSPEYYISESKKTHNYSATAILEYFKKSGFKSNQILQIVPCNDDFVYTNKPIVYYDFQDNLGKLIGINDLCQDVIDKKVMIIKVREEAISFLIKNMLPWEDLTIGFQARISRYPDTYESEFWYHFTNVYVTNENYRYSPLCGNCAIINQNKIWV